MGILSRATIIAALFTGASALHAFEQRTIWFNVPYNVTYPQTTAPSWPPTFGGTQNSDWTTYADQTGAGIMGLPTGGDAGILVPDLGQLFADLSVPANLQGSLLSATLTVDYYFRVDFTFTYISGAGNQNATGTSNADLTIYGLEDPALSFGDAATQPTILLENLAVVGNGVVNSVDTVDNVTATNQDTYVVPLAGSNLSILADQATPSFATLPVDFFGFGAAGTTGNYNVAGVSFGGMRIGITYTFVPESDWAWAGLPLVFGAWAVRRRMTNAKVS